MLVTICNGIIMNNVVIPRAYETGVMKLLIWCNKHNYDNGVISGFNDWFSVSNLKWLFNASKEMYNRSIIQRKMSNTSKAIHIGKTKFL